jgi:hypothetical protein
MSATPNIDPLKIKGNKLDATQVPTASNDSSEGFSVGSKWVDITNDKIYFCLDATANSAVWSESIGSSANALMPTKSFTLEEPINGDNITIFRTDVDITVQEVIAVSTGTTPSTTYTIRHGSDRSTTGNLLVVSAVTTSTTTGDSATLSDTTIPADSWIWFICSAGSGTNVYLSIDIRYTKD